MKKSLPFLVLFFLVSCTRAGPKCELEKFLEFAQQRQLGEAYQMFTAADRAAATLKEYEKLKPFTSKKLEALFSKNTSFKVKSGEKGEGIYNAVVRVTLPNRFEIMKRYRPKVELIAANYQGNLEKGFDELAEELKIRGMPKKTIERNYQVVLEQGEWKVKGDLGKLVRMAALFQEAKDAEKKGNFYLARKKVAQMAKMEPNNPQFPEKLKMLDRAIERVSDKKSYFPKVKFRKLKIRDPMVKSWPLRLVGQLVNTGFRVLYKVQVKAHYLNSKGKTVGSTTAYALYAQNLGAPKGDSRNLNQLMKDKRANKQKPLDPEESRLFFIDLAGTPKKWGRKIRLEVVDLEVE